MKHKMKSVIQTGGLLSGLGMWLFIYLFTYLLKAYSPVNRTRSPQDFCEAEDGKCDTQTGGLLSVSGKGPCSCEAEL